MLVQMLRNCLMADESSPTRSKSSEVWSCLLCHFQIFIYRRAVNGDLACLFIDLTNKNKCPRLYLEQWGVILATAYSLRGRVQSMLWTCLTSGLEGPELLWAETGLTGFLNTSSDGCWLEVELVLCFGYEEWELLEEVVRLVEKEFMGDSAARGEHNSKLEELSLS